MSNYSEYIKNINQRYASGDSTEHSYRIDLQVLINSIVKDVSITNEPRRQKCGAPDFIIKSGQIPIGYIETKDIGVDIIDPNKSNIEQKDRYLGKLDNIIFTDYLDFHFYRFGKKIKEIQIASIENKKIKINEENIDLFDSFIKDFCNFKGQTIKSAEKLAQMMAQKARMMEEVLFNVVAEKEDNTLKEQFADFKRILIHDLDERKFADIYAQTITYGLFAARLHDKTEDSFSRQEARELIPRSNPFLRNLFDYISGAQLDEGIVWIVDDLAEIFRATNLNDILTDFGKSTEQTDPFIHFYETFLSEYDKDLRKDRGVWGTPEPVVKFIVRAVDDILKSEFGLSNGLADNSKIKIKTLNETTGKNTVEKEFHKVQILDPVTGTGTFLVEVIKNIYERFKGQEGSWTNYVNEHLIPRLNGFEILMAPYTICHLKLEMLLKETGYKQKDDNKQKRLRVFLTNSLEEIHPGTGTFFAGLLSHEANEANLIKRDTPVMVVLGNPPYANFGMMNTGEWILNLIKIYKKDLNEKKVNLDDDYIKFIRYGEHFIENNGEGVLAYISNNSFLYGVTHRQMRKHLLETFDCIYIIDLHGNANQKELCPDGSIDQNVFDIMQGVSINIFIKTTSRKKPGKVYHLDIYGNRNLKYNFLLKNTIQTIKWNKLDYKEPYYFFVPKNFDTINKYNCGFEINEIFINSNTGIQTKKDEIVIQFTEHNIVKIINDFKSKNLQELSTKYNVGGGTWNIQSAQKDLLGNQYSICKIAFKPFDNRYTALTKSSSGFVGRPRYNTMKHMLSGKNHALLLGRQNKSNTIDSFYITNLISEMKCAERTIQSYHFPLYVYSEKTNQQTFNNVLERTPNLKEEIVKQIAKKIGLNFTNEKENNKGTFAPIDILDYIYAVLHSPNYREKYKEFLKIDFPRVPYPKDKEMFLKLVGFGSEIRQIHLLESKIVEKPITTYPIDGTNKVEQVKYVYNKVWINDKQYFDKVPEVAWEFYIGGYQPAQKWLKDRKDMNLTYDDIQHYQKIIVALFETDRLMKEIDKVVKF